MDGSGIDEASWKAAQRAEEWAGEVRVNLLRLCAIALFYGHHLVNHYVLKLELPAGFHGKATAIALAWTICAFAIHFLLRRLQDAPHLKYVATAWDACMITALLAVADGPRSPLVVLLFLLVASSTLRLRLRLVWAATALAIGAYAFTCGHAKWGRVDQDWVVPRSQQVIVALGLLCAGLIAGQAVRQARRFARRCAQPVRAEPQP